MAIAGIAPFTVTFTDTSTPDDQITYWYWDFGDGDTSTDQNPEHTYSASGDYTVTLSVASPKGTDQFSDTVNVYDLTDNLLAYWNFAEASGDRADALGTYNLTDNDTVEAVAGHIGNGATFAGAAEKLTQATLDLSGKTEFTLSAWVELGVGSQVYFATVASALSCVGLVSSGPHTNALTVYIGAASAFFDSVLSGAGTWDHVVFRYDGAQSTNATKLRAWVNGVETAATVIIGTIPTLLGGAAGFDVGWDGAGTYSVGSVDELAVWDRALSETEIDALYNGGTGLPYPFV